LTIKFIVNTAVFSSASPSIVQFEAVSVQLSAFSLYSNPS